jgi:hypothetical protein
MNQQAHASGVTSLPGPLGVVWSLLFFAAPTVALILLFHLLMPALIRAGLLPFYAYSLALSVLFVGLGGRDVRCPRRASSVPGPVRSRHLG